MSCQKRFAFMLLPMLIGCSSDPVKEECAQWVIKNSDIFDTPEQYDHWLKACQDSGGVKSLEKAILEMPKSQD